LIDTNKGAQHAKIPFAVNVQPPLAESLALRCATRLRIIAIFMSSMTATTSTIKALRWKSANTASIVDNININRGRNFIAVF